MKLVETMLYFNITSKNIPLINSHVTLRTLLIGKSSPEDKAKTSIGWFEGEIVQRR